MSLTLLDITKINIATGRAPTFFLIKSTVEAVFRYDTVTESLGYTYRLMATDNRSCFSVLHCFISSSFIDSVFRKKSDMVAKTVLTHKCKTKKIKL